MAVQPRAILDAIRVQKPCTRLGQKSTEWTLQRLPAQILSLADPHVKHAVGHKVRALVPAPGPRMPAPCLSPTRRSHPTRLGGDCIVGIACITCNAKADLFAASTSLEPHAEIVRRFVVFLLIRIENRTWPCLLGNQPRWAGISACCCLMRPMTTLWICSAAKK